MIVGDFMASNNDLLMLQAQSASARNQMAFQERMSNTAHVREVADLKAAGLNPVLSAGGSGASTPSGAAGDISGSEVLKLLQSTIDQNSKTLSKTVDKLSDALSGSPEHKGVRLSPENQLLALASYDPVYGFDTTDPKTLANRFTEEVGSYIEPVARFFGLNSKESKQILPLVQSYLNFVESLGWKNSAKRKAERERARNDQMYSANRYGRVNASDLFRTSYGFSINTRANRPVWRG